MNPRQAAQRWQQSRTARQRRDVELETFPTTAGSSAKTSHPMSPPMQPRPVAGRIAGRVVEPPAPAGLTSWGTWAPAPIEHVGGGFHLAACNLISKDAGWYDGSFYTRWAIAVWLIRPDGTISDPWVSDGNTARPITLSPDVDAVNAPPYGEPTELCMPKLARWQEGALLTFLTFTDQRQHVDDLSSFWPQAPTYPDFDFETPGIATVYRWIGHDGVDPVIGPALELYGGPDGDFGSSGDWDSGGGDTEFDDAMTEGHEVVGPSADPNIVVYGLAENSRRHRAWLLDKDPADHSLTLAQRTTFTSGQADGNPGGLTRTATDRWVALSASGGPVQAALFNAKTGTVLDTAVVDDGTDFADLYYINSTWGYHAGNHLHFDGQAVFAAWVANLSATSEVGHRHCTLTVNGDTLTADPFVQWATEPTGALAFAFYGVAERLVETCQGCLRLILTFRERKQALFEGRAVKAGIAPLPSPELPDRRDGSDQRLVPSSHPAGYMWTSNVPFPGADPEVPQLVRYPA